MFLINSQDGSISLSRGDTGTVSFGITGHTFDGNDRALFTVKAATGEVMMERTYTLNAAGHNGEFSVEFHNNDTDTWTVGSYSYDVRIIINPYWQGGRIVNGDQVITPKNASALNILNTIGEV